MKVIYMSLNLIVIVNIARGHLLRWRSSARTQLPSNLPVGTNNVENQFIYIRTLYANYTCVTLSFNIYLVIVFY